MQKSEVLVWRGEKEEEEYASGSLENVLAVLGVLVDGDDDGTALEVRGRRGDRGTKSLLQKRETPISKGAQRLSGRTAER